MIPDRQTVQLRQNPKLEPLNQLPQLESSVERSWFKQDLYNSDELYQLILSNMSETVFMSDNTGIFTFISPNVERIFGYSVHEIQEFDTITHLLGKNLFQWHDLKAWGEIRNIEREITDKAGQRHTLSIDVKLVSIGSSTLLYTCRDITDYKPIEAETYAPKTQLGQRVIERTIELTYTNRILQQELLERQQVEKSLRYSEAFYRGVVEDQTELIVRCSPKGILTFVNQACCCHFGKQRQDFIGKSFLTLFPEAERQGIRNHLVSLTPEHPIGTYEYQAIAPNGKVYWQQWTNRAIFNLHGELVAFQSVGRDITTLKQVEEDLKQQRDFLKAVVETVSEGITVYDNPSHFAIYNPRMEEITAYSQEEAQNANFLALLYPDPNYRMQADATIKAALQGQDANNQEWEITRKDGETRNILISTRILNHQGRQLLLSAIKDITERKQAEQALQALTQREREKSQQLELTLQELQHTQAQLVQNEKMVSLGQLVAGVAHEINNPTSFIYGNIYAARDYAQDLLYLLQLYQKYYPQPVPEIAEQLASIDPDFIAEDFPKLLGSMQVGVDRICQIVDSLKNFSRLDEKELKQVDIHEGIDNTLLILQHRLKQQLGYPDIQVLQEYGQLPSLECYPAQLNQVFMNLLVNAIDALEEWGVREPQTVKQPMIRIRTEVVRGHSPGTTDKVVIRIADNGPGMTEAVRTRIFDPFFTTKPVGKGTGLGLSISYRIVVDKHHGQLKCHSVVGQGTEFVIELPMV